MNWDIELLLDKEIIDSLHVFVLACVCGADNCTDAYGILIDQINSLLGIDHVTSIRAIDVL